MLATLLPGIREGRVPLAAGALWLVVLSVSTSWILPTLAPTLLASQVSMLGGFVGSVTVLAALAFVSYIIGVTAQSTLALLKGRSGPISATSVNGLKQRVYREVREARRRGVSFHQFVGQFPDLAAEEASRFDDDTRLDLAQVAQAEEPYSGLSDSDYIAQVQWQWLEDEEQISRITERILGEMNLAELSLQVTSKDVYDKYDRLRAEGEFRVAVAVPLAALSIALSIRLAVEYVDPAWLALSLTGALTMLIWRSGAKSQEDARDLMVQAVLGGQAQSPTLGLMSQVPPADRGRSGSLGPA